MLGLEDLERITDIVRRYQVPKVKVTSAQRLYLLGLEEDRLAELKKELGIPDSLPHQRNKIHYVQACPGKTWCKYGSSRTEKMAKALSEMTLKGPLPYKVKAGISGCRMCCCESWIRDVGLVAEKRGWRFTFGGNGAGKPRIGDLVADGLSDDEALELVEKTLNFYIDTAKYKTRSARFMERFGIETLRKGIGLD